MSDLVYRLRHYDSCLRQKLESEAADQIEKLRAENERLREIHPRAWSFPCSWRYNSAHDAYDTKCGNRWRFSNEGGIRETGAVFCPFCGWNVIEENDGMISSEEVDAELQLPEGFSDERKCDIPANCPWCASPHKFILDEHAQYMCHSRIDLRDVPERWQSERCKLKCAKQENSKLRAAVSDLGTVIRRLVFGYDIPESFKNIALGVVNRLCPKPNILREGGDDETV